MDGVGLAGGSCLGLDGFSEQFLFSLPKHKLVDLSKLVSRVRAQRFKRRRTPKYRFAGAKAMPLADVGKFFSGFLPEEWRYKVLFLTQAFLGLRVGEAVGIKLEDVDFLNKQVKIRTEKTGFYGAVDSMALHEQLHSLLLDYIQVYEQKICAHNGFLFYASRGHISTDYARKVFREVCDRVGLIDFYGYRESVSGVPFRQGKLHRYSTHSLRHSFAKFLCKRGVPVEIAKHLLRHQDLRSTQIYYNPDKEDADAELCRAFSKTKN